MARLEVRIYNHEEMVPENRMTYTPCSSRDEAKRRYAAMLDLYRDSYHTIQLCRVEYRPCSEEVEVLASSDNEEPRQIIWDSEYLPEPEDEDEVEENEDGCPTDEEEAGISIDDEIFF